MGKMLCASGATSTAVEAQRLKSFMSEKFRRITDSMKKKLPQVASEFNEALRLYTEIMNRESSHESEHQDAINKCTQKNEVFPQFKKANENLKLMKSQLDGHLADKKYGKNFLKV